jgi:hypothetical protein
MTERSTAGIIGIVTLSGLMLVLSFLFNHYGESNVALILLFSGIILAVVLTIVVLTQGNSKE